MLISVIFPDARLADASSELREVNKDAVQDDSNVHVIGSLLPDDEEALLAGVVEDFDLSELPGQIEEMEDFDIFGSGGGMELDLDPMENLTSGISNVHLNDGYLLNGISHYGLSNGAGTVVGEHPYGEHPSRTLFVRNINSNVEDSELRSLFEVNSFSFSLLINIILVLNCIYFIKSVDSFQSNSPVMALKILIVIFDVRIC